VRWDSLSWRFYFYQAVLGNKRKMLLITLSATPPCCVELLSFQSFDKKTVSLFIYYSSGWFTDQEGHLWSSSYNLPTTKQHSWLIDSISLFTAVVPLLFVLMWRKRKSSFLLLVGSITVISELIWKVKYQCLTAQQPNEPHSVTNQFTKRLLKTNYSHISKARHKLW